MNAMTDYEVKLHDGIEQVVIPLKTHPPAVGKPYLYKGKSWLVLSVSWIATAQPV